MRPDPTVELLIDRLQRRCLALGRRHIRDDAPTLWIQEELPLGISLSPDQSAIVVVGNGEPLAIPAVIVDGLADVGGVSAGLVGLRLAPEPFRDLDEIQQALCGRRSTAKSPRRCL